MPAHTIIRAILFDSDGVLVDTERLFFEATRTAFETAGGTLSERQWSVWYLSQGRSSREIATLCGLGPSNLEDIIAGRNQAFWDRVDQGVPLCSGVRETLNVLAPDFGLAVVTGASRRHFDRVHGLSGLRDFFQITVTSDDYEHVKPHPQAYLTAARRLSLEPHECLAIEDSPRGARAAVAAGMPCLVIPTALTDIALCPAECTIIRSLPAIVDYLHGEGAIS